MSASIDSISASLSHIKYTPKLHTQADIMCVGSEMYLYNVCVLLLNWSFLQ